MIEGGFIVLEKTASKLILNAGSRVRDQEWKTEQPQLQQQILFPLLQTRWNYSHTMEPSWLQMAADSTSKASIGLVSLNKNCKEALMLLEVMNGYSWGPRKPACVLSAAKSGRHGDCIEAASKNLFLQGLTDVQAPCPLSLLWKGTDGFLVVKKVKNGFTHYKCIAKSWCTSELSLKILTVFVLEQIYCRHGNRCKVPSRSLGSICWLSPGFYGQQWL